MAELATRSLTLKDTKPLAQVHPDLTIPRTEAGNSYPNLEPEPNPDLKLKLSLIKNEYNQPLPVKFEPLTPIFKDNWRQKYFEEVKDIITDDLEYLAITSGIETSSPKIDFLKELTTKLLGENKRDIQIAIQTRGQEKNAFTYPDGTIVVTQALINEAKSVDELASIIGHEIGHLVLETSYRSSTSGSHLTPGIAWVHEEGCDAYGMKLVEDANYNTMAFSNIIQRISGHGRGTSHQTGEARASYSYGGHMVIDSKTSHLPETPLPSFLHDSVPKTNIELVTELWDKLPPEEIKPVLAKLHPRDLLSVFQLENKKYSYDNMDRQETVKAEMRDFLLQRVHDIGLDQADGVALLGLLSGFSFIYKDVITTPEMVEATTNLIPHLTRQWQEEITKKVFKSSQSSSNLLNNVFLNYLSHNYYDLNNRQTPGTMPVDESSFLKFITACEPEHKNNYHTQFDSEGEQNLKLLDDYSSLHLEKNPATTTEQQLSSLRNFLQKAKSSGIHISGYELKKQYKNSIKEPDKQARLSVFAEVFELRLQNDSVKDVIDAQFRETEQNNAGIINLYNLFYRIREANPEIPKEEKDEYTRYIFEKIKPHLKGTNYSVEDYLAGNDIKTGFSFYYKLSISPEEAELNQKYQKFSYGIAIARNMYGHDSDDYYAFLDELTQETALNWQSLSMTQLINLGNNLISFNQKLRLNGAVFDQTRVDEFNSTTFVVNQYDRLQKHPLFQRLAEESKHTFQARTINELKQTIVEAAANVRAIGYGKPNSNGYGMQATEYNIFHDGALSLYFNAPIVTNLETIINAGIPQDELDDLYNFIGDFFPDNPQRNQLLRDINLKYLNSPDADLKNKTEYLIKNSDRIGPEGIVILAEQIDTIDEYREFKKSLGPRLEGYLNGSKELSAIATTDFATSLFIGQLQNIFETCTGDPHIQKSQSTDFALKWLNATLNGETASGRRYSNDEFVSFDKDNLKFTVNDKARSSFKSVKDIFDNIHALSPLQRIVILHKALTDNKGALTSVYGRENLSAQLVNALDLPEGLIKEALKQACLDIDAKLIALPTANMLGPLFGRSLQMEKIDVNKLKETHFTQHNNGYKTYKLGDELTEDQLKYLIDSPTQQITQFGLGYHTDPDSPLFSLSNHSDRVYDQAINSLQTTIRSSESTSTPEKPLHEGVDAGIEAIIKGVESSGALGIRALQLAVQFYNFPPEMHKRLSAAFDAVPALNKVFFWENLNRMAQDSPEIEELLKNTTVKKCLGGGSLQTTYEAHFRQPDGSDKAGTLKMKNPNVAARLKDTYSAAKTVLDTVSDKSQDLKVRDQARTGSMLIDLSQNWCLADINDSSFEQDDDAFKQTLEKYNQSAGFGSVYAPDRIFTGNKLTSEELVPGRTVNQILNDPTVDKETKQDLVWTMTEFFLYQLKEPLTNKSGQKEYLVHSDPHVGNMIADTSGEDIKMGVIDRSLFLKLNENEASIIRKMVDGSNISDFAYSTIDYLLTHNNVRGIKKGVTTAAVFGELASEFAKQFARGSVNKISLLNTLFMDLSKKEGESFEIPLKFRLMIRNIAAFQELTKRHGLELEEIARTTQYIQ